MPSTCIALTRLRHSDRFCRDYHFWVFAQQDAATGTFAIATRYEQQYSKDGTNWYVQPILPDTDNPTRLRVGPKV